MDNKDNKVKCKYCGKFYSKFGIDWHETCCAKNPNHIEKTWWSTGKTKDTDERLKKISESLLAANLGYKHYQKYLADNSLAYGFKNMQGYKKYFLEEQNHKCAVCGCLDFWNGKKLVFVLDHINGDANDNRRSNLRLVYPNCDSQLPTFKFRNRHSARREWGRGKKKEDDKDKK